MKKSAFVLVAALLLVPVSALAQVQEPIRVGGNVRAPERIKYVAPLYPEIAQSAGVGGIVILEAIIDTEGAVSRAMVIKSIPLLDQAAMDAVVQWKYMPTTLNGVPVPVIMTVTVNFTLGAGSQGALGQPLATIVQPDNPLGSDTPLPPNTVRIGGEIKAPERIKYVAPFYPEIAQSARVEGIVIIEAVIDADGRVAEAKVLKSIPLLDQAALDAVKQWAYTPTTVNGQPVSVIMTVTVSFTLK